MDDVWAVTPGRGGTVQLTLRVGPPRPLVGVLTDAELASVASMLPEVAEAVRRDEFSRIQLGTMFRTAIGRDPFKQATGTVHRRASIAWWAALAYIVVGLGFAAGHSGLWLRSAGWLVAAVGFGGLVEHAWRRRR